MPEVILLQDVENVGLKGELVDVKKGYLRNFLLPRKLAHHATPGLLAESAKLADQRAAKAAADLEKARELAAQLDNTTLTIEQSAGEDGRLFGSVTPQDVSDAIRDARGVVIDRRGIDTGEPIKTIGTHMVTVEVAPGVTATVKTMVVEK